MRINQLIISSFLLLILMSCSEVNDDSGASSLESTDSIVEYEINSERTDAVEFNNDMTLMQEGVLDMLDLLFQSDSSNVELNHENTLFELDMNLARLNEIKKDETKSEFANAMINLMTFYQNELTTGFLEVIPILKKPEFSASDETFLEDYDLRFVELEENAFEKVFISQEAYAESNNISLDLKE